MKTFRIAYFLPLFIATLFYSCYPEGPDGESDYNLLLSAFEPEYNFESANTFVLPDTLVLLNDSTATDLVEITNEQRLAFVEAVRDNLENYGWTDLSKTSTQAEVLVLVSAIVAEYSDTIWNEWEWYEGLENISPIGINTRYSWYPENFPYIYDFTKGSLLITMIDATEIDTVPEKIPLVWIGSLNGIISSKTVSTSNIVSSIDKLFELSDYPLNKN